MKTRKQRVAYPVKASFNIRLTVECTQSGRSMNHVNKGCGMQSLVSFLFHDRSAIAMYIPPHFREMIFWLFLLKYYHVCEWRKPIKERYVCNVDMLGMKFAGHHCDHMHTFTAGVRHRMCSCAKTWQFLLCSLPSVKSCSISCSDVQCEKKVSLSSMHSSANRVYVPVRKSECL